MTLPSPTPSFEAPIVAAPSRRPTREIPAPERRELVGLGVAAGVVALGQALSIGGRLLGGTLSTDPAQLAPGDGLLVVAVRAMPWLLGLVVISALFALRRLPRAHQRLLEPSLIAGWVTVAASGASVLLLGRYGVWPWTWATTSPETASLLARFLEQQQFLAFSALVAVICLLVPLLSELFFRFALLEGLRARGQSTGLAIALSALAYGLFWFVLGWRAAPGAALQQAAVAALAGAVLGTIAVRGLRGRGLGLCVLAHIAWMAADTYMLLRTLPTG